MEIGDAFVGTLQYLNRIIQETEQARVRLGIFYDTKKKFGEEESQYIFNRIA